MNRQIVPIMQDEHEGIALSATLDSLKGLARTLAVDIATLENILAPDVNPGLDFYERVRQFEINLIKLALERTNGHQWRAAQLLGLKRSTLNAKIKLYKINMRDDVAEAADAHVQ